MLKLIEIRNSSLGYDTATKSCKSSYSLKEIYLNPDHIILMRENTSLGSRAQRGPLIEVMDENASFTEVIISTPGHMSKVLNVVGSPEKLYEDFQRARG